MTAKYDETRFQVLRRILSLPEPLSFSDIGYLCGPNTIRTMAVNGFIDVKISIKPKGREAFEKEVAIRKKRDMKKRRLSVLVPVDASTQAESDGVNGMPRNVSEAA